MRGEGKLFHLMHREGDGDMWWGWGQENQGGVPPLPAALSCLIS